VFIGQAGEGLDEGPNGGNRQGDPGEVSVDDQDVERPALDLGDLALGLEKPHAHRLHAVLGGVQGEDAGHPGEQLGQGRGELEVVLHRGTGRG
jgi:hypothetical protein